MVIMADIRDQPADSFSHSYSYFQAQRRVQPTRPPGSSALRRSSWNSRLCNQHRAISQVLLKSYSCESCRRFRASSANAAFLITLLGLTIELSLLTIVDTQSIKVLLFSQGINS